MMGATLQPCEPVLAHPNTIIAADEVHELESIAAWCRRLIAANANVRLLVILPGSAGARERLATLIRQAVDPDGWLAHFGAGAAAGAATESLVVIEGGAPLSDVPVVGHALAVDWGIERRIRRSQRMAARAVLERPKRRPARAN
jgi:hypothetical protein